MLGVVRAHLDEVAVVAGDVMHLEDFGELGERLRDPILGPGFVAANRHEGEQPQAEGLRVDLGGVALRMPRASSLRIRSRTAEGASPTALAISTWVSRALAWRRSRIWRSVSSSALSFCTIQPLWLNMARLYQPIFCWTLFTELIFSRSDYPYSPRKPYVPPRGGRPPSIVRISPVMNED